MGGTKKSSASAHKLQYRLDVRGRGQLFAVAAGQSPLNLLSQLGHLRYLNAEKCERLLDRSDVTLGRGDGNPYRAVHPVEHHPYRRASLKDVVTRPQTLLALPIHEGTKQFLG